MPFYTHYACSVCGEPFPKELLVSKTATFSPVGSRRILKSRVTKFLCPEHLEEDVDYQLPPFHSPGTKSAGLERVRKMTGGAS
jgi:DNA-directed RNA polymerase subunit RPC12/RpoP